MFKSEMRVDMSSCGVLVSLSGTGLLSAMLEGGERARVHLELPQVPCFRGCWLDCKWGVVRVAEQNDAHLIGLHVSSYHFRSAPPGESRYFLWITGHSPV